MEAMELTQLKSPGTQVARGEVMTGASDAGDGEHDVTQRVR